MVHFPDLQYARQCRMLLRRLTQFAGLVVGTVVLFFAFAMTGLLLLMMAVAAHHH
jgi:hypothetical protein